MYLQPGERLSITGSAPYCGEIVVGRATQSTPWCSLHEGQKVLYNFDFATKGLREAEPSEWLDVFIRVPKYPTLDDPGYVADRRALARSEIRAVLGLRPSHLWPEALDLIETTLRRDAFTFKQEPDATEPIAVFARTPGVPAAQWQERILPVTTILTVLAELLDFVRQNHENRLILQAISMDDLRIDNDGRVSYLGSDRTLPLQHTLLDPNSGVQPWRKLFPPERFPAGYSAPECVRVDFSGRRPDSRSDLYSWGCVAYALLTGRELGEVARQRGQRWWRATDDDFRLLRESVAAIPSEIVANWAEQLGVPSGTLALGWPDNLVNAFRLTLDPEPTRRPASSAEWRSWLATLPLAPLGNLDAVLLGPAEARLIIDVAGALPDIDLLIQRRPRIPPEWPGDGVRIYEGPPRKAVEDLQVPQGSEDIHYAGFCRRSTPDGVVYSPAVTARLWKPTESSLCAWAEQHSQGATGPASGNVANMLNALPPTFVGESLQASRILIVRLWGLHRLDQALRSGALKFTVAEPILWRYVHDPVAEVRVGASVILWSRADSPSTALLVKLVLTLGETPIDRTIDPSEFLERIIVPEAIKTEAMTKLDRVWPIQCPVCRAPITLAQRTEHLRRHHGYVPLDGEVVEADQAASALWSRLFDHEDPLAHDKLAALYPSLHGDREVAWEAYANDLAKNLLSPEVGEVAGPIRLAPGKNAYERYLTFLRQTKAFPAIASALFRNSNPAVNRAARDALLPMIADHARKGGGSSDAILGAIRTAFPVPEFLPEKIGLCQSLEALGFAPFAVQACIERLKADQLVRCRICSAPVSVRDLEQHLRDAHRLYEFRGEAGSYRQVRHAMIDAACSSPPDLSAWDSLLSLARFRSQADAERTIAIWLLTFVRVSDKAERLDALQKVANLLANVPDGDRFLSMLAAPSRNSSYEKLGQRLALEGVSRLKTPLRLGAWAAIAPLLSRKEFSRRLRQKAAAALLRATTGEVSADSILQAYISGTGKLAAISRLRELEPVSGRAEAIERQITSLDLEVRMTCPRCQIELSKRDMELHLWDAHRLVLDNQVVRDPWKVLDDWAVEYGMEKDPNLLRRCRQLAEKADPVDGLARFYRLTLRHHVIDREIQAGYSRLARQRASSICPSCFALCPVPADPSAPFVVEDRAIESNGYRLSLDDRGITPKLLIETPEETTFEGREPGAWLSRFGMTLVVFIATLAGGLAFLWQSRAGDPRSPYFALMSLGVAFLTAGFVQFIWPTPRGRVRRLLRAAWNAAIPELLAENVPPLSLGFIDGVARLSTKHRRLPPRLETAIELLDRITPRLEKEPAARSAFSSLVHANSLRMRERGDDPIRWIVSVVDGMVTGRYPLSLLDKVLTPFLGNTESPWSVDEHSRLGLLLAELLLSHGWTTEDFDAIRRVLPATADVLGLDNELRWRQIVHLYSLRESAPWKAFGAATTAFDLARDFGRARKILPRIPDVLLSIRVPDLFVGSRGVWFQDQCITNAGVDGRVTIAYKDRRAYFVVGSVRIAVKGRVKRKAAELERWLQFYFTEFLPRAAGEASVQPPKAPWRSLQVTCPHCGNKLAPCLGDLGLQSS